MKPSLDVQYCVEPSLDNGALFLVRDGWLIPESLAAIKSVDPDYEAMVRDVAYLKDLDFSSLRDRRPHYATQTEIPIARTAMMGALAIHYGLDYGLVARYLGREYTGQYRNFAGTIAILEPHVTAEDLPYKADTVSRLPTTFSLGRNKSQQNGCSSKREPEIGY